MEFYQLHASIKDGLLVSGQDHKVRVDVVFDILRGIHLLELLNLVPLLFFLGLFVKFVDLSKVKLRIEVIRVNESCLGVVLSVKLFSIDLGAALSAAPAN